ncbi:hypothetical protein [Nocardioides sp. GXQ0305]|uniref:hypothetical protein n=1 Tax=Nocardioides sp. GXQ0305 TaxID=3423912 RepID=UPI003D7C851D
MDRMDKLVAVVAGASAVAVVGMFFDRWTLVYYAVPVLTTVLLLMGALDRRDQWSRQGLVGVSAFGALLVVLFVASHLTLDREGSFGGLPTATAIFVYLIWPVTSVVAPLLYAVVYQTWLRRDLEEPTSVAVGLTDD